MGRTLQETKAFPGRVIFDHLPKTAGQAINTWLARSLGSGCVTTNLVGEHAALVRQYGGRYSIISAHVIFRHGEQLDPRYQYITLLREPLDRAISWIYFLINNVPEDTETYPLIEGARKFVESEGEEATPEFFDSIRSPYVEHFSRVAGHPSNDDQTKLACALAAISRYEVVGLYEHMSEFMLNVARLIGIEPLERLSKVNVTSQRPKATEISPTLRERLVELNRLDLEFYNQLSEFRQQRSVQESALPAQPLPGWRKFDEPAPRVLNTPDVSVAFISLQNGTRVRHGVAMTFDIEFLLTRPIEDLEITLSLMDEHDSCAFSINSTQIGTPLLNAETGSYQLSFKVAAILPDCSGRTVRANSGSIGTYRFRTWVTCTCPPNCRLVGSEPFRMISSSGIPKALSAPISQRSKSPAESVHAFPCTSGMKATRHGSATNSVQSRLHITGGAIAAR